MEMGLGEKTVADRVVFMEPGKIVEAKWAQSFFDKPAKQNDRNTNF